MINNIYSILKKYNINNRVDAQKVTGLTSNLQKSKKGEIVFYTLRQGDKSWSEFIKRLNLSQAICIIVNGKLSSKISENIIELSEKKFKCLEKELIECAYPIKKKLALVGVTGTNGKTSVVNLAVNISNLLGYKAMAIGTLGITYCGNTMPLTVNTTPSYLELSKIIYQYQEKIDAVFFEISSHALEQERLYDLKLSHSGWTNFSQDHLDYHKSIENYLNAKLKISKLSDRPIVISRSEGKLECLLSENSVTFEVSKSLDSREVEFKKTLFEKGFNRKNMELALELCEKVWGQLPKINLKNILPPKGRFSTIRGNSNNVIIDYAHTPDALKNVLLEIKNNYCGKRIIIVFGCGGDRDRTKRPLMGKVASLLAEVIYLTNDNPRTEDETQIINDVIVGIERKFHIIYDRKKAIEKAVYNLKESDILLVAGKGHENYQEVNGVKTHLCDFESVSEALLKYDK